MYVVGSNVYSLRQEGVYLRGSSELVHLDGEALRQGTGPGFRVYTTKDR